MNMKIKTYTKENLKFTEISNNLNLKVTFCSLGASIYKIHFDRYLLTRNVKNIEDFKKTNIYYGKTIGRVASRIKNSVISFDNKIYHLINNDNENTLHGGPKGLSHQNFYQDIVTSDDRVELKYFYFSPDLEGGFPGNLKVEVKYIVYLYKNELDVEFTCVSDKLTPVALTNHTYFTLANNNIRSLFLKINASDYLLLDDELYPLRREKCPYYLDFSSTKRIIEDIENENLNRGKIRGYDLFYYFNNRDINLVNATLSNSKIQMDIMTDFQGLQIYSSCWPDNVEFYPDCEQTDHSVALEPCDSYEKLHLLKPNEKYHRTIKYLFKYKDL